MRELDRKALIRQYKENAPPAGVFQVKNLASGKVLIGVAPNLPGMLNRQRFELEMGSHADAELQADWNDLGPASFEFSVLDELEVENDDPAATRDELRVLHALWLERLAGCEMYPLSAQRA